jgi:HEAT repeat protein
MLAGPRAGALSVAVMLFAGGCGPTIRPSFESVEPAARNAAIVDAARSQDASSIPQLVRMLSSDDATTRVLAICTLERVTQETHGYDPTGSERGREEAIGRWEAWVASRAVALRQEAKGTPEDEAGRRSTP